MATTEQIVHTLERMALRREHSGCVTDKGRRWAAAELEALRAAIALMRGQSWQDIETAPKDGTYVLVANSHGSWIAKWHPVYQSGYRPSNPWASMMLNHDHIQKPGRFDKPTHWQPIPAPPKDPADEQ